MHPRQIFNKEKNYTEGGCQCDICATYSTETCLREYEYIKWLEDKYEETHND